MGAIWKIVEEAFGEITKEDFFGSKTTYKCDIERNLIEYSAFYIPADFRKTIIKYNENGEKIESAYYYGEYFDNNELFEVTQWKYNNEGQKTEENIYNSNRKLIGKKTWKYNNNGQLIDESVYDSLGTCSYKEIREYDKKGICLEHTLYRDGKLWWKCSHKLDNRGNYIENVRVGRQPGGFTDTLWVQHFKYDEFDNRIEFDEYQKYGDIFGDAELKLCKKQFSRYNKDKIKIEERDFIGQCLDYNSLSHFGVQNNFTFYNSNGNLKMRFGDEWHEKYDDKGNLIERLEKNDYKVQSPIIDGKYNEKEAEKIERELKNMKEFDVRYEYIYTYDKYGNWATQTIYKQELNSLPICTGIVEREIEYYE